MSLTQLLFTSAAVSAVIAIGQWLVMRMNRRRLLAAARERHSSAQRAASEMLTQCRCQIAQLQKDLAAARLATRSPPRVAPRAFNDFQTPQVKGSAEISRVWRAMPNDAFADTIVEENNFATTFGGHPGSRH